MLPIVKQELLHKLIRFSKLFQTNVEKQNKALHGDIADKTQRLDDQHTALAEADITHKKLSVEKSDLEKQIDEADKTLRALSKIKASLATQVTFKFSANLQIHIHAKIYSLKLPT